MTAGWTRPRRPRRNAGVPRRGLRCLGARAERPRRGELPPGVLPVPQALLAYLDHPAREDLEQAALLGFLRACELFDPATGHTLATYSACWIKQAVREVLRSGIVRVPTNPTAPVPFVNPFDLGTDGRPVDVIDGRAADPAEAIEREAGPRSRPLPWTPCPSVRRS